MVAATQTTVSRVLARPEQLRVPLFQRHYQWGRKEWQDLWNDVARLARERRSLDSRARHFLGSVVVSRPHATTKGLLVVDGQQRLITLGVLLCAIRDSEFRLPASQVDKIQRALWMPKPNSGSVYKRVRVLPTQVDQEAYARILAGEQGLPDSRVTAAYRYFMQRIRDLHEDRAEDDEDFSGVDLNDVTKAVLQGLECVLITAQPNDNAHRIFESLNNTGLPLSQADLIRNYVLMRLDSDQEDFYEFTFRPLEGRFTADEFTQLFWLDLILSGYDATQRQTYAYQQRRMEHMSRRDLRKHFESLSRRADLWQTILQPALESSAKIRLRLQRIRDWGTTTAAPTLLYLLERRHEGLATYAEVARAMHYLESYFVRRVVMGRATMNMNRILMDAPASLAKDRRSVDEALRWHLSGSQKYWASDAELRTHAASKPFYKHGRGRQKALILRWIEEALHNNDSEVALVDQLSLEHVMPQTLTDAWSAEIKAGLGPGEKVGATHSELVDTIGNLTLTTYKMNSSLSNRPFAEKKAALRAKGGGSIALTQQITSKHHWRPGAIRQRSRDLVELIIDNWPGPVDLASD